MRHIPGILNPADDETKALSRCSIVNTHIALWVTMALHIQGGGNSHLVPCYY